MRCTPRSLWGLGAGAWGVNEARLSAQFFGNPETSVRDIHRRVMYMKGVQERLDLDHVTLLDVDMGAHMFYTDWAIVDIAGLVDVPMARHSDFNKRFLREYLFEERRPDFAHVHGGWARASRIPKIKGIPGPLHRDSRLSNRYAEAAHREPHQQEHLRPHRMISVRLSRTSRAASRWSAWTSRRR